MDAIGTVGGARHHLMQEDDAVIPFAHLHRIGRHAVQPFAQRHHLVIMGGEQSAAFVGLMQMLRRRPGDGQAVIGGGAAPDLVQYDQRFRRGLVEDRRRLHHLHHEGGAARRQIVARADAAEQPVHDADMGRFGGHETAHLGQDGDQRILAQEGGFARHVGTGDQPQPPFGVGRQVAVVGHERAGMGRLQRRLHHRMAAAPDVEGQAGIHFRAHIARRHRQLAQACVHIQHPQRIGDRRQRVPMFEGQHHHLVEQRGFQRQGAFGGLGNARRQAGQLVGGKAHRARHGLAVTEGVFILHQLVGVLLSHLDEIAQHAVMLDPELADTRLLAIAAFQACDDAAGFVAQGPQLIQRRMGSAFDEAAVTGQIRRLVHQQKFQPVGQARGRRDGLGQGVQRPARFAARRVRAQQVAQGARRLDPVAQGRQVARSAARHAETAQGAGDVGRRLQRLARLAARFGLGGEAFHRIVPRRDGFHIGQRRGQAAAQQARAAGGDGAVDLRQQRAAARTRQGLGQFQVAPRGGVDAHEVRRADPRDPLQRHLRALLGQFQIGDQRPRRRQFGAGETAEPVQRLDIVMGLEGALAIGGIEARSRQRRQRRAQAFEQRGEVLLRQQGIGHQQFAGRQPRQFGGDARLAHRRDREFAGGHIGGGDGEVRSTASQRHQQVGAARFQQRVLGQGAGRHQPHHLAPDHRLGATLLGLGRVFHLLTHRHAVTLADQLFQIGLGGMNRHAAHGDVLARMFAALGQGDVQGLGRLCCIREEQLVEIPHAIEQQVVGMGRLQREILRHHGGGVGADLRHRRRSAGVDLAHAASIADPHPGQRH